MCPVVGYALFSSSSHYPRPGLFYPSTFRIISSASSTGSADARFFELSHRLDAVEGRVLSMETAAPLRDKIVSDSILALQANLANISGYMVKASALPEAA